MLAVGVFPAFVMQVHAQQEVDPDHFEQHPAAKAGVNTVKAQTNHHAIAADHQARKPETTASKQNGGKAKHHHVQA